MLVNLSVIILAAGEGSRMKSTLPKVMHHIAGKPLISYSIDLAQALSPIEIITLIGPNMSDLQSYLETYLPEGKIALQDERLGTAHAVKTAFTSSALHSNYTLILYGDVPLITKDTIDKLLEAVTTKEAALGVIGFEYKQENCYGRLILDAGGNLSRIVETKDADLLEKQITLCNSAIFIIRTSLINDLLNAVSNNNLSGEYYLTDIVEICQQRAHKATYIIADASEMAGVNTRRELAAAEAVLQWRLRNYYMDNGVTMIAPETVFLSSATQIDPDVIIHPYVTITGNSKIASHSEIKSFTHIDNAIIGASCKIGPYARLRPHSIIGSQAVIGNFVEIKNSLIENDVKISHLSYVGDSEVGHNANIGAGAITCNYDGINKHKTTIGAYSFIGSNSVLVAPLEVAANSFVAAGSVITKNVEAGSLAVARAKQYNKKNYRKLGHNTSSSS